ncbi:MAG: triose-phosphate isomerase [bacterium]
MRKKIIAGNWKMNKLTADAAALASALKAKLADRTDVEVVICPTFTVLKTVGDVVAGTQVKLGAQNMHWEKDGAFTGEISADMLRDVGCQYVILGHSERRQFFGETDGGVNRKVKVALAANLTPIVCVGETLEEREANKTEDVVTTQVTKSLAGLDETSFRRIVVAYEPVWAIGTGRTATPAQAQEVHALIRKVLAKMCNPGAAQAVRIQYGGSMKPANARELMSQPDIDGGLIGGAALDAASFISIVEAAV